MKTLKLIVVVPLMALVIQNALAKCEKVALINTGEKQHTGKNEISGNSKEAADFRMYDKGEYRVLSSNGIVIYSKTWLVQQGKGPKQTELFYFSAGPSAAILPLTIANLESVYGKNQKFIYAVESLFKSDGELASYDQYNKQYKLTFLYKQSVM